MSRRPPPSVLWSCEFRPGTPETDDDSREACPGGPTARPLCQRLPGRGGLRGSPWQAGLVRARPYPGSGLGLFCTSRITAAFSVAGGCPRLPDVVEEEKEPGPASNALFQRNGVSADHGESRAQAKQMQPAPCAKTNSSCSPKPSTSWSVLPTRTSVELPPRGLASSQKGPGCPELTRWGTGRRLQTS